LPGFPMAVPFVASYPPAVADLDGNGDLEILLNSLQSTSVSVIQHDGANSGVPVDASRVTSSFIINAPLVEDVDGDGSLETVIGGATSGGQAAVYIFEESASSNDSWSSLPWSMFQRAPAHTSLFLPPELSFPAELRFYHQQGTGSTEDLRASIANIGGMPFDWNVDVTGTSGNVSVNSNTGTLDAGMWAPLTFTANTLSCPPFQWCNLGNVSVSATLNGANARSSPRAVAVWLYVGDVSRIHLPAIRR
jgi:hypothetical protein